MANLDFAADESFTLMFAGRTADATPAADSVLVAKKADLTTGLGYAMYLDTAGTVNGVIGDGTFGPEAVSPAVSDGTRFVAALVRDVAAGTITMYLDGVAGTPVADTTTGTLANSEVLRSMRLSGAGTAYYIGQEHVAALWRRALTAVEVAALALTDFDPRTVPDVVGLTGTAAQAAVEAEGLVYAEGVSTPVTDSSQAGLVQTQTPTAGDYVATGTTISVSLGVYQTPPVVVPSYMGLEFRGVRMGVGESVLVKELAGWEDQSASPGSPKLAAEHGGAPIRKLAEPLTITAVLALVDPTARDPLLAALSVAGSEEVEHQLIMRNDPFGAPDRFRWARVDDRRMPRDRLAHAGVSKVTVRWEARDPRLYALTEESIVLAPYNAGAGGIDFPWDFPLDFTAPVGTEKVATVTDGDNPAYPVIRFINQGATTCTQVTLFQRTSLQVLDIVTPIAAGETLTVDLLALIRRTGGLTVYLGGVSRYGAWTPPRDPLHLDPGDNRLRFTAEPAGVDMICGISWRPTWL